MVTQEAALGSEKMASTPTQIAAPEASEGDLREMGEEQFIELFEHLRERTCDFKEFSPCLLLEDSRRLLLLRLCLGLSQREFARALGRTKDWVRHTEAGRRRIVYLKIANRYVDKINSLLNQKKITLEQTLENWKIYKFSRDQNLPEVEARFKPFLEINVGDFKKYFQLISVRTEGFTKITPELLAKIPQSILILRIALGINHRKFAKLVGVNNRTLRAYEHLEMKMKPETAAKFAGKIQPLFEKRKIMATDALENFRYLKGIYGYGKLNSFVERGFKFAERTPPNPLEHKIRLLLESANIPFKIHARVQGLKRDHNVDFAIPNAQTPLVIIEVVQTRLKPRKKKNYRHLICLVDHRFQMIKAKHPNLITILIFWCCGPTTIVERVKEVLKIETLNTDIFYVNEKELDNLIPKIENHL